MTNTETAAQEEVKGEWIPSHPTTPAKEWKCTDCQELVYTSEFVSECDYERCPNCGSKNNSAGRGEIMDIRCLTDEESELYEKLLNEEAMETGIKLF